MTSEVVGENACYEWPSYIRGFHKHNSVWLATVEEMLRLTKELTNPRGPFAVAVINDGCVEGHILRAAFGKDGSIVYCEVAGAMVNCAAGFGLEIPCVYQFIGCLAYIDRLKNFLQ